MADLETTTLLPAAEYVRMSTDQQQYSLDNQSDTIRRYAEQSNMRIVRTYKDAGKTGLTLTVNGGLTIRPVVTRCRSLGDSYGWLLRLDSPTTPDVMVIARLAPGNCDFLDYFLLKSRNTRGLKQLTIRNGNESIFEKYRYDDLSFLRTIIRLSKAKLATLR